MAIMWRSGVALILLIVLVALAARLWLDGSEGAAGYEPRIRIAGGIVGGGQPAPLVASGGGYVAEDQREAAAQATPPPDLPVPAYVVRDPGGSGAVMAPQDPDELSRRPAAEDDLSAWQDEGAWTDPAEAEATTERDQPRERRMLPPGVPRPAQVALVVPVPRPVQTQKLLITNVQQRLATLGYNIASIDGRSGMRTEAAVRDFQKSAKLPVDGRITEELLGQLDGAIRARAEARPHPVEVVPAAPPPERKRGVFGSVLGGFQRLLGQDFDGINRPAELAAYCRGNADTWIYDFGREAFVYCGNVNADSLFTHPSAKPATAEAAAPGR